MRHQPLPFLTVLLSFPLAWGQKHRLPQELPEFYGVYAVPDGSLPQGSAYFLPGPLGPSGRRWSQIRITNNF